MAPTAWELYLFADATAFALISIYAITKIILSSLHDRFSYFSQRVFRSLALSFSVSLSFIFIVIYFHSNDIGNDFYQTLIICLTNATCLAFFFQFLNGIRFADKFYLLHAKRIQSSLFAYLL